jgi:hypothetical protein
MQESNSHHIVTECLGRWRYEDERTKYFSDIFNTWVASIPKTAIEMIFHLLSTLCYYPHRLVNEYLVELHNRLNAKGEITNNNTIYISIKSRTGIGNSSNDYWVEYKFQNRINKYICFDDIRRLSPQQHAVISNIVIIDDCSGSGKTLVDYLRANSDFFRGKNIFFITIHVMKVALENINIFAKEENLKVDVLFIFEQDKAFKDEYFKDKDSMKDDFIKLSRDLNINDGHILGFEESEGLFAFYNNTPNNTLGLFRYDIGEYRSLFPRKDDKKPTWWNLKENKQVRKAQNYHSKIG